MERESQIEQIRIEFIEIQGVLDERSIRRWCAAKSRAYNRLHERGGVTIISEATGVSRSCIYEGIREIEQGVDADGDRIRKRGGGRKKN